jgi:hypothetical protein
LEDALSADDPSGDGQTPSRSQDETMLEIRVRLLFACFDLFAGSSGSEAEDRRDNSECHHRQNGSLREVGQAVRQVAHFAFE